MTLVKDNKADFMQLTGVGGRLMRWSYVVEKIYWAQHCIEQKYFIFKKREFIGKKWREQCQWIKKLLKGNIKNCE